MGADPLLVLRGVEKAYGSTRVLAGVDMSLGAGESRAILGPSGSGKSTLLAIAGTLEPPSAGTVEVGGRDVTRLGADELARFRAREIGFVFQHHHLLPQLSALENVLLPTLAVDEEQRAGSRERAEALLERVGLADRRTHRPGALSGGERQRVAVVRALINGPRLVLADEPTGALDARSAGALCDLLVELEEREGVALLVVTHSEALAARMHGSARLENGVLSGPVPAG